MYRDLEMRISVPVAAQRLANLDLHSQFFTQFPDQCLSQGLPSFDLAAGEFPQPTQQPAGIALVDQRLVLFNDHRGGNLVMRDRGLFGFNWQLILDVF